MLKIGTLLLTTLLGALAVTPACAADAGAFARGRTQFTLIGGSGAAFGDTYFVLGVGASYYIIDGLNIGLYAENWSGGDPGINKITPSVQYVFYQVPRVTPYLGAFYRRTYVDGLSDLDSTGGRAGVYLAVGGKSYIGLGAVYETYLSCDKTIYTDCSDTYPEISFTFSF
jgi:hypothetical protein